MKRTGLPLELWLARRRRRAWVAAGACLAAVITFQVLGGSAVFTFHGLEGQTFTLVELREDGTARLAPVEPEHSGPVDVQLTGIMPTRLPALDRLRWIEMNIGAQELSIGLDHRTNCGLTRDIMAYLYLPDGRILNEMLIRDGLARVSPDTGFECRQWFLKLEGAARADASR